MKATIVFQKNYDAINAIDVNGIRTYRHIVNTGSSRSSKTYSLIQLFYLYAFSNKNKRLSVWRDTKKDCKDTVLADMKKAFIDFENYESITFNKTESIFTFPNNSTIEICGTDDEEKIHGFQGDVIWLNEPYKISKDTFDQLSMRTSDFVLIDWNPKKTHWIDTLSKQDNSIVIHSTFKDNPFCPLEQKKKILSYEPNDYNNAQGTADKFMWECYGLGLKAEKPNRIYKGFGTITKEFYDGLPYNEYYGMDFGSTNPSSVVGVKFNGENEFYSHEYLYKPIREMFGTLAENLEAIGIRKDIPLICDSADPTRIGELQMAGFNAIPAVKGQGSVNQGIGFINSMRNFYTECSLNYEHEYENYEWEVVNGVNLDRPIKKDDHILDADRYCKTFLQFYLGINQK